MLVVFFSVFFAYWVFNYGIKWLSFLGNTLFCGTHMKPLPSHCQWMIASYSISVNVAFVILWHMYIKKILCSLKTEWKILFSKASEPGWSGSTLWTTQLTAASSWLDASICNEKRGKKGKRTNGKGWKGLFNASGQQMVLWYVHIGFGIWLVFIFSTLFSKHFLWYWQGEFVWLSVAS